MSDPAAFWQDASAKTLDRLSASREGLRAGEAAARLDRDGPNEIAAKRRRHLLFDLLRRLANPLVAILLAAAAIAGATGDVASFAIIVVVVILSTGLDMVQEHRAEATAEALKRSIALRANVLRDGKPVDLPVADIVAGDVVQLCAGDLVPADGIALAVNGAQVNEALLTGEPYPVEKQVDPVPDATTPAEARNALFHGSITPNETHNQIYKPAYLLVMRLVKCTI